MVWFYELDSSFLICIWFFFFYFVPFVWIFGWWMVVSSGHACPVVFAVLICHHFVEGQFEECCLYLLFFSF